MTIEIISQKNVDIITIDKEKMIKGGNVNTIIIVDTTIE